MTPKNVNCKSKKENLKCIGNKSVNGYYQC